MTISPYELLKQIDAKKCRQGNNGGTNMEMQFKPTSKKLFLKPRRSAFVFRSVDFLVTNPPLVGIVEHYTGDNAGYADEGVDPRVIAVFPPTEDGIERAYETLGMINKGEI